jgi:hypothetical protein
MHAPEDMVVRGPHLQSKLNCVRLAKSSISRPPNVYLRLLCKQIMQGRGKPSDLAPNHQYGSGKTPMPV